MATPVSGISLANLIKASPFLTKALTPIANTYYKFTAYQQIGFRYDDLIPEENLAMIKALKRLSPKEHADRVYRMRVASQCSMSHTLLPKEQWTTLDQDHRYISNILKEVEAEEQERADLDAMIIRKKPASAH
ncbi:cytochrome b-c1 complex subunit 7 [Saitoella complicata NRRL Y-17804]|uniref:cytochrome b-c1 complex subunit 7 n=1 Tax=Saitoella complicata (strain BCRC 22490 / CBS 7301 / JCM 7358 / NBRC 10748 / NRRL Y-17804) TaxID=698492 RepID=UPI00086806E9|nr:cytochrome b-c1 complex subunit 7 [Saitoella complicata NRRL Y-17804]ODQ52895.1 cytochrome b-c1 complex subunit 7 [Saitoella complicata NRRL Y-17804]